MEKDLDITKHRNPLALRYIEVVVVISGNFCNVFFQSLCISKFLNINICEKQ